MKSIIRWLLLGLFTLLCIFFLSNIRNAFMSTEPDQIRIAIGPDTSIHAISSQLPGSRVLNEKAGLLSVPYGTTWDYIGKTAAIKGIFRASSVPLETPVISWKYYAYTVKDQLQGFLHGDLGKFRNPYNRKELSVLGELPVMLLRTCTYFIPGLLLAIALSMLTALAASMWRRLGAVLDGVHALLVGLPDFFLIVLIQLGAVYATKFLGHFVLLIVQVGDKTPFMIPFLTIALIPSVTIYGTLRIAIARELAQDYVVTAQAKGLTRGEVLFSHVVRNVMADLLGILPKATTLALASMAVAEAICGILGLGGFIISPALQNVSSMSVICIALALVALAFHALYALLRKRWLVRTGEVPSS
ncbi:ABC transporter permease subunit [Paenibacillus sp. GCM10023248]|uniref:ABC transporter permease subunit n=1 Tax=Bacillales TaxID=1385 RepID=UPI00237984FC|nr:MULTISPECIES: ABC transporter permease subunit [Bacillales]MDD9270576.1 ABC transporter permease subunit [Paenibacillus sp. MAHUQ-63]MDR6884756.1 ABC-type dipeptide/oligopeptide/nickel transport system permease component [Bacillus sp. 3255]